MDNLQIKIKGYPQQMEFIQSETFLTAFVAGVNSGKSYGGALKALSYCLAYPGSWGIVTAPQHRVLEIATIPTYEKVFPSEIIANKKMSPHPEWRLHNGCRIFFWSTDKPETISGAELAWAHMDEASLSPYLAFLNIKKRLRQKDKAGHPYPHQLWVTTTPRQWNWLYQECSENKKELRLIRATTRDNIYAIDIEEYISRLNLSPKEYQQDIEGEFTILSGECLFTPDTLSMQLQSCEAPIEIRDNGKTLIWRQPVVGVRYIAGADCADEGGGGANDMVIIDAQTGELMAEVYGDVAADYFSLLSFDLLREYNNPLFAPERNGTVGGIVTQKFIDMGYANLYKDDKNKPGWYTTTTAYPPKVSRFTMLKEFEEAVRLRRWIERNSDAVGEYSTFANENGKYKARPGYRDDRLMARAICWQLRKEKSKAMRCKFISFKREFTSYS